MAHRHGVSGRDFWDDVADAFGIGGGSDGRDKNDNSNNDEEEEKVTITKTKYQTAEPTFEGEIGGFSTVKVDGADPPEPTDSTELPDQIKNPGLETVDTATLAFATDLADNTGAPALVPTTDNTQLPAASSTTELIKPSGSGSGGTSTAARAGIAIGVLAAILIVFGLVYFAMAKRRKRAERQSIEDDEKLHGPFAPPDHSRSSNPPVPPAKAPRLSLRPVSQFLSNVGGDKRASRGAVAAVAAAAAPSTAPGYGQERSGSAWERPLTSQSHNPANPFGHQAERIHTPIPEESSTRPVSPLEDNQTHRPQPVSPMDQSHTFADNAPPASQGQAAAAAATAGAAAGVAAGGLTRQASRNYGPKTLDLTVQPPAPLSVVPPSPAGTDFSVSSVSPGQQMPPSTSAAAIAAAGGPPSSTVHRVQLDFKPTLEDEMELRAGDLVRLLHEYDDGWALVIRLDRSKQGVVPRTCLSTRPVKPRQPGPGPRGPPVNPSGRPMTPQGHPRPQSPAGYPRPQSPAGQPRPQSPAGMAGPQRPASPAGGRASPGPGQRPQSPGPRYQGPPAQRPQSPNGMGRKPGPPGPSPMGPGAQQQQALPQRSPTGQSYLPRPSPPTGPVARKPVPGQAY